MDTMRFKDRENSRNQETGFSHYPFPPSFCLSEVWNAWLLGENSLQNRAEEFLAFILLYIRWTAVELQHTLVSTCLYMACLKLTFSLKSGLSAGNIPLVFRSMISCTLPRSIVQTTVETQPTSASRFFKPGLTSTSRESVRVPGSSAITIWIISFFWRNEEKVHVSRGFSHKRTGIIWSDQNKQGLWIHPHFWVGTTKTAVSVPNPGTHSSCAVKISSEMRNHSMSTPMWIQSDWSNTGWLKTRRRHP